MKIIDALKRHNIRISNGDTWLIAAGENFTVYRKPYGRRNVEVLIITANEYEAVAALVGEGEGDE